MHDGIMTDGYDVDFLGTRLPLPRPNQTVRTLPYPRFTVLLDPERRLAAVTAVNIDGATLRDLPRTGDWRLDERLPPDEQAGPEVYARNDLDRGHLVRRRDPGWGPAATARAASEATFFYPNAATAGRRLQSVEAALARPRRPRARLRRDHRAARCRCSPPPVLAENDPSYRGIRVPLRF